MADMELLLVYAWWCSLCVWEKGEVFATEGHGKMKRKGLFCHEISKSFLSVFFRGFHGKKTKTRLLALINAKVQCLSLAGLRDRKSTRLNSSHVRISYAVFCLKKKKKIYTTIHM